MKKILLSLFTISTIGLMAQVEGTWMLTPKAGAFGVGPAKGDYSWWSVPEAEITGVRACQFDDEFVFNADGSFKNILGDQTFLEGWQGFNGCGTPVAPHDGKTAAKWSFNKAAGTVTLIGKGAFLGFPKPYNLGELQAPANAPDSIVYEVTVVDANNIIVEIKITAGGAYWKFDLTRKPEAINPRSSKNISSWGSSELGQLGNGEFANPPKTPVQVDQWVTVAAGNDHTLAINSSGELYAWGINSHGQLGLGHTNNQNSPQRVGSASNWTSVVAGNEHSLAINSNGQLYAWGRNLGGALGLGVATSQNSPQRVGSASNWSSVVAGEHNTLAINSNGELFAWGNNVNGQLGLGTTTNQNSPQRVGGASNWTSVVAGSEHTLAINSSGELFAWGNNVNGQLGLGTTTNQNSPQRVGSASNWSSVRAGMAFTVAINTNGELYAWGANLNGQLGLGNNIDQHSPQRVGSASNWTSVGAGNSFTLAINAKGALFAWGANVSGQLGIGSTTNQNSPQRVGSGNKWSSVMAGSEHTLAINSNGDLYSWGANLSGQLGLGNNTQQNSPQQVGSTSNWISVVAGGFHTLAINANGELYAWGTNNNGQLGLGNTTNQNSPQRVGSASNWSSVVAGMSFTLAINSSGELYSWGINTDGQLGLGHTNNQNSPQRVGGASNWTSITAGSYHSLAINSSGELFAWGYNGVGQLGLGNSNNPNSPQRVGSASNWSSVVAKNSHTLAINSNGELYAWGWNGDGQLGLNSTTQQNSPQLVGSANNWTSVAAGANRALAINSSGELFAWGYNGNGELGVGDNTSYDSPKRVGSASNWTSVTAGTYHTLAINSSGELFAWGNNGYGQLGLGNSNNPNSPQRVGSASNWSMITAGSYHTLAINTGGKLYAWGRHNDGQLGLGDNIYQNSSPQQIGSNSNWRSVVAGGAHNLAINASGELYAWGDNIDGQLGLGNTTNQNTPQRVGSGSNWTSVAAGAYHTLAINSSGELFAWGYNEVGQLGVGDNTSYDSPKRVGSASNWTSVAAGYYFTLAINSNGELYSWGSDFYGQLGLGNNTNQNSPQRVGGASNWTSVVAGGFHALAINSSGQLYAWGANLSGPLGLGDFTNQNTPQRVVGASNWTSVAAGYIHTLAINANGELYAWGANSNGQLGLGNNTSHNNPQRVGSARNWSSVVAGDFHTLAINSNGQLHAWGSNRHGQLGLGNLTDQNSPQRVGSASNWTSVAAGKEHTLALQSVIFIWSGTGNSNQTQYWSTYSVPTSTDSAIILSGTMTVNQPTTFDALKINNGATVKLEAPLTLRNLHLHNGSIDLNGHRLTITGGIYQSINSTNYYIQAGTTATPKPLSELVFAPTANTSSTLYFTPNANTLKVLELGTASKTATATLGNAVKIKGGTKTDIGSLKINNGSKLIIPSGASLTLACDTFNSYLNLSHPAQRAIHCSGTGTFNIERQHYGARGWRIYSHPFTSDINLTQIEDDIDLIGSGGIAEGFADDVYKNTSAYWYDYSKADTTNSSVVTDPAWTGFSSAKGTAISGNPNKWKKHAPIMLFNPGAVRGSGAFSNPGTATYQQGKITLSYVLDSTAVHLNDGKTQTISTAGLTSAPKSRYFFITNPFTAPIRLGRIQGLNLTNCANKFYYWKQNQASISSNFMPAAWASEALFNGNATRDSNISIPAFGTILIEMKNSSSATTFTIPESAKQLTNFNYLVGGDLTSSGSGVKQTLFLEIPQTYQGPGGIEVQLLMNDSIPVDRMLIYDRIGESPFFTNNDAKKFKEPSFANIYSLTKGGELLSLDAQDITARLQSGEPSVEIPLIIERDFNKAQGNFRLRIWEKQSELQTYFKDAKTGQEYPAASFDDLPIAFEADETVLNRYSLVFKRNSSSTEDFPQEKEVLASQAKMDIIVYPNPVADYIHIRVTNNTQYLPYALYSSDGRVVKTGNIKNFETLDIKSLSKGIYYLNCNGNSAKFIKP